MSVLDFHLVNDKTSENKYPRLIGIVHPKMKIL